jgi:hypothetical protein
MPDNGSGDEVEKITRRSDRLTKKQDLQIEFPGKSADDV